MLSSDTEVALIDLVRDVAKAEIMPRFRALSPGDIRAKTAPDDLVTEADLRAEAAIAAGVRRVLPSASIVGEEGATANSALMDSIGAAELCVIVDPVDGTWNFTKGLATFGVIVAVVERGRTVFGVLYDPVLDDWVWARAGGGAWYQRPGQAARRLSFGTEQDNGLTGFVPIFQYPAQIRAGMTGDVPGVRRIWSVRCSCHEYRMIAQGHVDFGLTSGLKPWDHAAGALAVAEAGGAVGLIDGRPYSAMETRGCLITARSEEVLGQVRRIFAPLIGDWSESQPKPD